MIEIEMLLCTPDRLNHYGNSETIIRQATEQEFFSPGDCKTTNWCQTSTDSDQGGNRGELVNRMISVQWANIQRVNINIVVF